MFMHRVRSAFLLGCCMIMLFVSGTSTVQAQKKRYNYEKCGDVVWEVSTDQKVIALTFDDGPDIHYTENILDVLKLFHAKATFFILGSMVEKYPDIARREVAEGHELANHTYHHPTMRRISPERLRQEIVHAHETVERVTGAKPTVFRPPAGVYSSTMIRIAKEAGYKKIVMWSWDQDTKDWSNPGVDKIVDRVLSHAHNGGIVLFHDTGGDRSQTVAALREILPKLQMKGFRFVTVSELLQIQKMECNSPFP